MYYVYISHKIKLVKLKICAFEYQYQNNSANHSLRDSLFVHGAVYFSSLFLCINVVFDQFDELVLLQFRRAFNSFPRNVI